MVVNNGWLGMVRQWQELFHAERFSETHLTVDLPDYVKLAEAFGIAAFRCETTDEVDAAIRAALECGGPAVIDARVDHEEKVYPMVPAGGSATDIIDVEWAEDDNALGRGGRRSTWSDERMHTLSVLVQNRPGVLTRCAGLFARRGFNIESLAVGPTEDPSRSRITIRIDCSQHSVDQVTKQLYKLVDVLKVQELGATAVELELLMIKVTSAPERRPEIICLAEVFESRVVDVGPEAISFACVGPPDRLQALEELLRALRHPRAGAHRPDRARPRRRAGETTTDKGGCMSTTIYYESDCDPAALSGKTIAVIGYGSQGHAHALNNHESGNTVVVGARPDSRAWKAASADGLPVATVAEATAQADIVMVLVPDHIQAGALPRRDRPQPAPRLDADVRARLHHPLRPDRARRRHRRRDDRPQGARPPRPPPVHAGHRRARPDRRAPGRERQAHALALAYGHGIGCARGGLIETTFAEETETDLFGEQAVLCGGVTRLIQLGFETLVEAGYQPEIAYFECLHELKLIVDLI